MDLPQFLALLSAAAVLMLPGAGSAAGRQQFTVFVGTYAAGDAKGIHAFRFDAADGTLAPLGIAAAVSAPSFLAVHPNGKFLYSVNESGEPGRGQGGVSAFAVGPETGKLTLLNRQDSGGNGPCHLSLDSAGRRLFTANYGGGSVAMLPVRRDGLLEPAAAVVRHAGSGVHPVRQTAPHAHGIYAAPGGRHVLAVDLGLDKVLVYRAEAANGALPPHEPPFAALRPGAGPRHLAFHPGGRFAYVANELDSTVTAFAWRSRRGVLEEIRTVSTLPEGATGQNFPAEIAVHPDGRFLYVSNRGHDSLAVFTLDCSNGVPALTDVCPARGKFPRHFALDPSGRWLLAANQKSDNVAVFRTDAGNGRLSPSGEPSPVPAPACIVFVPDR